MGFIERLADHWSLQGLTANGGATAETVQTFESTHRVTFPDDFREYLLRLNGLPEFTGAEQNGFGFLTLRQLRPVAEAKYPPDFGRRGYFIFADYLDWSWGYALQLVDDQTRGEVIHVGTLKAKVVAPNFGAFIDLYLVDSAELYPERSVNV
jgi:hypothetical protein